MQTKSVDPLPFTIAHLPGERTFESPLDSQKWFDEEFMVVDTPVHQALNSMVDSPIIVEKAGPRKKLYFNPSQVTSKFHFATENKIIIEKTVEFSVEFLLLFSKYD
jgi:hypothetical protein